MNIKKYFQGLWKDADFMKFWAGETLSLFGKQITVLAIPLVAAITLHATPAQMGILNASEFLPYLLITLFAGVWIDRKRRRTVLIGANIGRAVLLGLIPISFILGILQIEYLFIIVFLAGILTVFFDLAYQSYLPFLVSRSDLVEGNSKLLVSGSSAQIGGPSIGGVLIAIFAAPLVIVIDSFTYLFSAIFMTAIRKTEPVPKKVEQKGSVFRDIKEGMGIVIKNPYLRALAGEAATFNMFNQVTWAVLILYLTRSLHMGPSLIGIVMATSSAGALLGALIANAIGKRLRTGPTIFGSMLLACAAPVFVPLAGGPPAITLSIVILAMLAEEMGVVISNVYVISLRQTITPENLLGRMNASYRFVVTGVAPVGALIGGTLGTFIGLRLTLFAGAIGTFCALLWVCFSPVPKLSRLPTPEEDGVKDTRSSPAP